MIIEEEYEITTFAGTSIVDRRVCFDKSNKFLFCCVESLVKVFCIELGECVEQLRHDRRVIAVENHPENPSHILTCSVDGEVVEWDFKFAVKIKTFNLPHKFVSACIFLSHSSIFCFTFAAKNEVDKQGLSCFAIMRNENEYQSQHVISNVPSDFKKFSVDPKGEYVALVNDNIMRVQQLKKGSKKIRLKISGRNFVCVQCHPTQSCIATGDDSGRVVLWYRFFEKRYIQSVYHWHSTEVSDIAFPIEGSSMYTGGWESVVVKWSLSTSRKQETKEFMARLNAKILHLTISPDSSALAISLDDNSIVVSSSRLDAKKRINAFVRSIWRQQCVTNEQFDFRYDILPLGLQVDSVGVAGDATRGCIFTNGTPGHIQFYNVDEEKQKFDVDVVGRNLPPIENKQILSFADVVRAAIFENWLATIEYRPDDAYTPDYCLKFWCFDDNSNQFELTSSVNKPHMDLVTDMAFCPTMFDVDNLPGISLVTTSLDVKFKVWTLRKKTNAEGSTVSWEYARDGSFKDRPAYCCTFNANGKCLAVGFGNSATFWQFDTNRLLLAMKVAEECEHVKKIVFGTAKGEEKMFVALTSKALSAWDLETRTLLWRRMFSVDAFCFDSKLGRFAVFAAKSVGFFRISSPEPILIKTYESDSPAFSAVFVPEVEGETSKLLFMTQDQKIKCFCRKSQGIRFREKQLSKIRDVSSTTSLLAKVILENRAEKTEVPVDKLLDQKSNLELLNGPAHTLPDLKVLGRHFLRSCLAPRN